MTSPTEIRCIRRVPGSIRSGALKERGISIFPPTFDRQDTVHEIKTTYTDITHDKSAEKVSTAGRIYIVRNHGKTIFADLGDETGKIQLYIRKNDLGEEQFDLFNQFIERGDIIGVTGHVFRTKLGEITIWVDTFTLLCKAVCSLPEKFHGLTDVEKRYRQRYVDLIVNEESRQTFRNRSRIVSLIRRYLDDHGFLEFETPILQPVYGGANARPFTSYHNFLDQKLFLRIAPELYLKRLVVGGFEKVFEIARNFRNEAVDADHNPEFSMVEIYWAYQDFQRHDGPDRGHRLLHHHRSPWEIRDPVRGDHPQLRKTVEKTLHGRRREGDRRYRHLCP